MNKEPYISDRKCRSDKAIEKRTDLLKRLKQDLLDYRPREKNAKEQVTALLETIEADLQRQHNKWNEHYPEGVYVLYCDLPNFKEGTLIQRKTDVDDCYNCIFKKIPCLRINSYYGCHIRQGLRHNTVTENGELVNKGYFAVYNEDAE